jgi:hypothetical protein
MLTMLTMLIMLTMLNMLTIMIALTMLTGGLVAGRGIPEGLEVPLATSTARAIRCPFQSASRIASRCVSAS